MQSPVRPKCTLYVDAHVHVRDQRGFEMAIAAGVAAFRDAGLSGNAETGILRPKDSQGPAMIASGWALYRQGGYGSRLGRPVLTRAEIKSEILGLKRAGADIIKVIASGLVNLGEPGTITPGGFSQDDLTCIVEEAGRLGLGVMAHANGEDAIIAAAQAGVISLEHGFFMTERALDHLAEKRVYWTPTAGALVRAAASMGKSRETEDFVARLITAHLAMVNKAFVRDISLAVGTDYALPGPDYKAAYVAELVYFEQAGISNNDVLRIACEGGAKLLGMSVGKSDGIT